MVNTHAHTHAPLTAGGFGQDSHEWARPLGQILPMAELPSPQIQNILVLLVFQYWLIRLNHINVKTDRLIQFRQVYHFSLEKTVENRALISKDFTSLCRDPLSSYLLSWASANQKKYCLYFCSFYSFNEVHLTKKNLFKEYTWHGDMIYIYMCIHKYIFTYNMHT